jgi:hypothetical protein
VGVVVLDVGVEHCCEVAASADEDPVEAFSADGGDEAFGVGVGLGSANRGADHREPLGAEHLVERGGELRVAVADQEPAGREPLTKCQREVAGLLGDSGSGRVGRDAGEVDATGVEFNEEQDVETSQEDGLDAEEVGRQACGGLAA